MMRNFLLSQRCRAVAAAVALSLSSGCTRISIPWMEEAEEAVAERLPGGASNAPLKVKVDGSNLLKHDDQVATTRNGEILPRVDQWTKQQRNRSVRMYIRQRPDMALEALRDSLGKDDNRAALHTVAVAYDELLGVPAELGWQATLKTLKQRPEVHRDYAALRTQTLESLASGQPALDAAAKLVRQADKFSGAMASCDAYYLQGIALLLAERAADAAASFSQAHARAAKCDGYQQAQYGLLLSDALRRAGQLDEADAAWNESVLNAAMLAGRDRAIIDPVYWDKASYLRPVKKQWPSAIGQALAPFTGMNSYDTADVAARSVNADEEIEAIVWAAIGNALLERDDPQAALLALKRAEAAAQHDVNRRWLRLQEGATLARLDQGRAAIAILASLVDGVEPAISQAATATLGSLKLRGGDTNGGYQLLAKALEQNATTQWTGRNEAEADLGLACLMRGEEKAGLTWLHSAQSRFASTHDDLGLAKCLWNEEAYFKHAGKKQDAAAIKSRLEAHEASTGG